MAALCHYSPSTYGNGLDVPLFYEMNDRSFASHIVPERMPFPTEIPSGRLDDTKRSVVVVEFSFVCDVCSAEYASSFHHALESFDIYATPPPFFSLPIGFDEHVSQCVITYILFQQPCYSP